MPTQDEILAAIIEFTAQEAGVDESALSRDTRFADDLDVDSLGLLTIATQVEERCGVTLDDAAIPTLDTIGAMVDLVAAQG